MNYLTVLILLLGFVTFSSGTPGLLSSLLGVAPPTTTTTTTTPKPTTTTTTTAAPVPAPKASEPVQVTPAESSTSVQAVSDPKVPVTEVKPPAVQSDPPSQVTPALASESLGENVVSIVTKATPTNAATLPPRMNDPMEEEKLVEKAVDPKPIVVPIPAVDPVKIEAVNTGTSSSGISSSNTVGVSGSVGTSGSVATLDPVGVSGLNLLLILLSGSSLAGTSTSATISVSFTSRISSYSKLGFKSAIKNDVVIGFEIDDKEFTNGI